MIIIKDINNKQYKVWLRGCYDKWTTKDIYEYYDKIEKYSNRLNKLTIIKFLFHHGFSSKHEEIKQEKK